MRVRREEVDWRVEEMREKSCTRWEVGAERVVIHITL